MKPLFTIHSGEYLVGSYIERKFKHVNVWLPSRDIGVDLLVTDGQTHRAVRLQVKFSKDYLVTDMGPAFQKQLRTCGWFPINRKKLQNSPADFWVFVLLGFARRTMDFLVVPRRELWRQLQAIHGPQNIIQSYLWVTEQKRCWETRGLRRKDQLQVAEGTFKQKRRDFTTWLNNWSPVERLNK